MKRVLIVSALCLACLIGATSLAPPGAYEEPLHGEQDPCTWCAYSPQWCWLCYMLDWWESGCFPGDPGCIDW